MAENANATLRWEIDKDIDLYKFYLDLSVKVVAFLMATTGALTSYYFSQPASPLFALSLLFPALMNAGFAVLFGFSIERAREIQKDHVATSQKLGVEPFDMNPLRSICQLFCWMCSLATLGLLLVVLLHFLRS